MPNKYFLSLCCIIRDELDLEEWIVYNYIIGVQHFYIYDNESKIPIRQRLNNQFFKDLCTIIPFPGKYKQIEAYHHCINNFKEDSRWMCFVDGDEYILPKQHPNLRQFLKNYKDAAAIAINWIMFGSNFHEKRPKGLMIENFTACKKDQQKLL